jgi:energy-converting hydrogenase Eha subunit C
VFGRDSDVVAGIALIRSGLMGIVAARRYYLRRS